MASPPDAIVASFAQRSYAPSSPARLTVTARARSLTIQIFVCGPGPLRRNYYGEPVGAPRTVRWSTATSTRTVWIAVQPEWRSGLYFVRLEAPDGRTGRAPFIVRPAPLGRERAAIILPTNTWQAYNLRDMDGDGVGDSWYADSSVRRIDLARPYLRGGMPPHFRSYDLSFLRWAATTGKVADYYADDDFVRFTSSRWLASHYDMIIFPGHEEYTTEREYDLISAYRNRGGNLAFLSANNFYYKVITSGRWMYGRWTWRSLGRPEAALIGVQYLDWYEGRWDLDPYVARGVRTAPWLFEGTGLRNGDTFGNFGIEIDARTAASPRSVILLARAPNIFGVGKSAEMTYYRTRAGAKVFAAGVLNFGGWARYGAVRTMVGNLWAKLSVR